MSFDIWDLFADLFGLLCMGYRIDLDYVGFIGCVTVGDICCFRVCVLVWFYVLSCFVVLFTYVYLILGFFLRGLSMNLWVFCLVFGFGYICYLVGLCYFRVELFGRFVVLLF